jgi:hypothetical protein
MNSFFTKTLTGWDDTALPKRSESLWSIDGDYAKFPIVKKYTLNTPSNGLRGYTGNNPDVLIEKFLTDEDALFSWLLDYNKEPNDKIVRLFSLTETTHIQIFKYDNGEINEVEIDRNNLKTSDEIIEMILTNPSFKSLKERAEEIAKENEKAAIEEFNDRKKTVRLNNFKMWQSLNEKYLSGEFKEFLEMAETK